MRKKNYQHIDRHKHGSLPCTDSDTLCSTGITHVGRFIRSTAHTRHNSPCRMGRG